jgi:hypothetical protein
LEKVYGEPKYPEKWVKQRKHDLMLLEHEIKDKFIQSKNPKSILLRKAL